MLKCITTIYIVIFNMYNLWETQKYIKKTNKIKLNTYQATRLDLEYEGTVLLSE